MMPSMQIPTSPDDDDVARLRRILKRERRAWHLSAFADFVLSMRIHRGGGWFTPAMPVSVADGRPYVDAACARARWTRARTMALWASRELERVTTKGVQPA